MTKERVSVRSIAQSQERRGKIPGGWEVKEISGNHGQIKRTLFTNTQSARQAAAGKNPGTSQHHEVHAGRHRHAGSKEGI